MKEKSQIQKEYEALSVPPGPNFGSNFNEELKKLATKHNITYDQLLDLIDF